jgi:hypothetical protein
MIHVDIPRLTVVEANPMDGTARKPNSKTDFSAMSTAGHVTWLSGYFLRHSEVARCN